MLKRSVPIVKKIRAFFKTLVKMNNSKSVAAHRSRNGGISNKYFSGPLLKNKRNPKWIPVLLVQILNILKTS